jgi:hypothetical protein
LIINQITNRVEDELKHRNGELIPIWMNLWLLLGVDGGE